MVISKSCSLSYSLQESDNGAEKMLASVHHEVEDNDLTTGEYIFHCLHVSRMPQTSL